MRRFLMSSAGLLLLGMAANAQYYPRGDSRYERGYAGDYDRGDYYRGRGDVFARVFADLDRAEAGDRWSSGDHRRFAKVREELSEFQRSGSRHELNDAIGALQRVVNDNRMSYRDREVLNADLYQLRDFRARNGWR